VSWTATLIADHTPNWTLSLTTGLSFHQAYLSPEILVGELMVGPPGITGPQGDPGATLSTDPESDTGTGLIVAYPYGEALSVGDAVCLRPDGKVYAADATSIATGRIPGLGLALATAESGSHDVLVAGTFRYSGAEFVIGAPCYLSTQAGGITQTQPANTDEVIQVLGVATGSHTILFWPTLTYITHT
jgi:hypothetical protein